MHAAAASEPDCDDLILRHLEALRRLEADRRPARERLVEAVGEELAGLLLTALCTDRPPAHGPGRVVRFLPLPATA